MLGNDLFQKCRRPDDFSLAIYTRVLGIALGQEGSAVLAQDAIVKLQPGLHRDIQGGLDHDQIIVAGRLAVFALGFRYREKNALVFNGLVGQAQETEQLVAADFEPTKVVSVVSIPHVVGVTVDDAARSSVLYHG